VDFNVLATGDDGRTVSVQWPWEDQRTPTFKKFRISLNSTLELGEKFPLSVTLTEARLFDCSREEEFWDNDFTAPTERTTVTLVMPRGMAVSEISLVSSATHAVPPPEVLKKLELLPQDDHGRESIVYELFRPLLAGSYDLKWRWSSSVPIPRTRMFKIFNGWSEESRIPYQDPSVQLREFEIVLDENTRQIWERGKLRDNIGSGTVDYHLLHLVARWSKEYDQRYDTKDINEELESRTGTTTSVTTRKNQLSKKFNGFKLNDWFQGNRGGGYIIKGMAPIYILEPDTSR